MMSTQSPSNQGANIATATQCNDAAANLLRKQKKDVQKQQRVMRKRLALGAIDNNIISVADNARKAVEDRRNLKRAVNDRTVQSGSQEIVLNTCALARKSKIFKGQELVSVDEVVGRDAENQEEEDITHINRMLGLDGSDEASDYYLDPSQVIAIERRTVLMNVKKLLFDYRQGPGFEWVSEGSYLANDTPEFEVEAKVEVEVEMEDGVETIEMAFRRK